MTRAPAVSSVPRGAVASTSRGKPTRPLFNSLKKPITTTTVITTINTVPLPTKPMLNGSSICDPLIQEIWSYKDAKDYVMEKMFQGINAAFAASTTTTTPTQAIFEEIKVAAAESPSPLLLKAKSPIVCTPEEKKELELFERVEAEIDKFGEDEEEAVSFLYLFYFFLTLFICFVCLFLLAGAGTQSFSGGFQ